MPRNTLKTALVIAISIMIGAVGYAALTIKDQRSPTDKISDAIHELPNGFDKAAGQLNDRTPEDKIDDAIKDEKEKLEGHSTP